MTCTRGLYVKSYCFFETIAYRFKNYKLKLSESITNRQHITIRELVQFIGNIEATFKAVLTGPLHYRDTETSKITKLKENVIWKIKENSMDKLQ